MFREEQRNHEFFTAITLPNPRSGDPGSHSTRSDSPKRLCRLETWMRSNRRTCAAGRSRCPAARSRATGTPASVAGVDAWSRLNAAEVPSDHHDGFCERGKWLKLALVAAIRKLVARGDTSQRQDPLWQDALAGTLRRLQKSHLATNSDAHVGDGGRPTRSNIGRSLRPHEGTTPPAVAVALAGGVIIHCRVAMGHVRKMDQE